MFYALPRSFDSYFWRKTVCVLKIMAEHQQLSWDRYEEEILINHMPTQYHISVLSAEESISLLIYFYCHF